MHGNYFYFKVPFRSDFSLKEGNILQNQAAYSFLWKRIKQSVVSYLPEDKNARVEYFHDACEENDLQFESIDKDSSLIGLFSPIVLNIISGDWIEPIIDKNTADLYDVCFGTGNEQKIHYVKNSCKISLYKNTLSTVEFCFRIEMQSQDICSSCIKKLEKWSNDFSKLMVEYCYQNLLLPLIEKLRRFDDKYSFFCSSGKNLGFPDIYDKTEKNDRIIKRKIQCGVPLWVSRSLVIGKKDEGFETLVNRWVIATDSIDDIIQRFNEVGHDEKNKVYLGWMHSIMLGDIDDVVIRDSFFAQGLAQYYYSIFESLNQNLSQIIGLSYQKKSVKQTREYKAMLEEMIFVTDLIKINFSDITQGLQRNRAYFFNVLMERWTIDNIMENVKKKIVLCKDNINRIYQRTLTRSQKVAALLLFFISGFAILEFLRGLTEFLYGPESIVLDVWGIYNIGQLVGPNTMLWIGLLLFGIIFMLYSRLLLGRD